MRSIVATRILLASLFALALPLVVWLKNATPVAAATDAGTAISVTVNVTYVDPNANNYSGNSNTIVTVVQNAPTLTNVGSSGQTTVPGQVRTDSFTLTNTGNNASGSPGYFQVDSGSSSLSGAGATITGYTYTYNGSTSSSYSTISALNTALSSVNIAETGATSILVINVTYSIPTSATPTSISDTLAANVTYPGGGSGGTAWSASTSADATTAITDTVVNDARLDLALSYSQDGTTGAITYTIKANNGGSTGTADLQVAKSLLGASNKGVLIVNKIPQFAGTPLTVSGTLSVSTTSGNGYAATNWQIYTTSSATGAAGTWSTAAAVNTAATIPAGTTYVALYLTGGASGIELAADASGSTGANAVTAPAVTMTYTVGQPTGNGSGDAGAVQNIVNALWGDNQPTEHVLGPGIPTLTADSTTTSTITTTGQGLNNTVSPPGSGYANGASNLVLNQALGATGVLTGPCCTAANAAATGSYDGSVSATSNNDFTAVGFTPSSFIGVNSGTVAGTPVGNTTGSSVSNIKVENGVENTGNASATVTLSATAPTSPGGWTVGLYTNNAGAPGSLLTGASVGATSTGTITVASGTTTPYWAVYTAPSGVTTYTRYDATITATSGGSTNSTHNEMYPDYVAVTTTASVPANGCPSGMSLTPPAAGVCPGGTIQYVIDYRNIVVGCLSGT